MTSRLAATCLLTALVALFPALSSGYDLQTHGLLSARAVDDSIFLRGYLESVGLTVATRLDLARRSQSAELAGFENDGTPLGWLVEGAIREDDYRTNLAILGCAKPKNPPSAIDRVRNHFYDPDTNGGLRFGPQIGLAAPEWALGELGRGPGAAENQFSL